MTFIFVFQLMYMYAYYIYTLYYTVDTYLTAVCINVYKIMFKEYITAFACFDGLARTASLITDSSYCDF